MTDKERLIYAKFKDEIYHLAYAAMQSGLPFFRTLDAIEDAREEFRADIDGE